MRITRRPVALTTLVIAASCLGASPALSAPRASHAQSASAEAPVNINTASVEQLMTLSGVKRPLAEKIVAYRAAQGRFKKPEDLRNVGGVGRAVWERNKGRIVVR